jgi:hypothetical protein
MFNLIRKAAALARVLPNLLSGVKITPRGGSGEVHRWIATDRSKKCDNDDVKCKWSPAVVPHPSHPECIQQNPSKPQLAT